jgi:5-methylcytosine-specific restriction protein A
MPRRPPTHGSPGRRARGQAHAQTTAHQAPRHDCRPSAARRGYDHDWRRCQAAFLAANPLCADCLAAGRTEPAREAHHVVKVRDDPGRRLDWANLLPLCKSCHSKRTARGE